MRFGPETRVLITGATGGVGRLVAARLAERGCRLGLLARSPADLHRLAGGLPAPALTLAADVGVEPQVAGAVDQFVRRYGGIDLWIDAAGTAAVGDLAAQLGDRIDALVDTNVLGALFMAQAVAAQMVRQQSGHIVLIAGAVAWQPMPQYVGYSATKAGLRTLGESLWHELGPHGVTVTTAYPATLDTRLHRRDTQRLPWLHDGHAESPDAFVDALLRGVQRGARRVDFPRGPVRNMALMSGLSPRLVDFSLRQMRGHAAAPRRR